MRAANTNSAENRLALAAGEESRLAVIAQVQDYLQRTGLTAPDFASRLGYGTNTLRLFLRNEYHLVGRSSTRVEKACLDFIHAHPITPPMQMQGELYETANVRFIRETFDKLLPRPAAGMIYAPPGSQKSFALEHQVAALNLGEMAKNGHGRRAYYTYCRQGIRARDLLRRIAVACGSRSAHSIENTLANLAFDFQHRRVLLVLDEAQHLEYEALEVVRELLDRPPYFSILFAGSHDLKQKFDRMAATLEQWNSRILAKVLLPGLLREEASGIAWREIGPELSLMDPQRAAGVVETLIDQATSKDAFQKGRAYINVRTLTNSLNHIKEQTHVAS